MKTQQFFFMLILLVCSSLSHAVFDSCIGKDKKVAPSPKTYTDSDGKTQDTDAFKAWRDAEGVAWSARQDWGCCTKLELNAATSVCEDKSLVDSSQQKCTTLGSPTECSDNKGCFPLRDDDMFTTDDPAQEDAMAQKEAKYDEQQNSLGDKDPKAAGDSCYRNMECESYNCKNFECIAPDNICRLAGDGEVAVGGINCEEPLTKDAANSKCGDSTVPYYTGLLGDILVGQKSGGTRCEFQLYPQGTGGGKDASGTVLGAQQIEGAVNLAIKTIRSMEWLYSTPSNPDHKDCLFTRFYMKTKLNEVIDERKEILRIYNVNIVAVEENFKQISLAQLEDKTSVGTLCSLPGGGFEVTTNHDIASRKSTGLDFLCYMKERNSVYLDYETRMKAYADKLHHYIKLYTDTVFTWGAQSKSWTTGDKSYSYGDRGCRDWTDWHKKIKRRWSERYKVRGKQDSNKSIVDKKGVTEYLKFVGEGTSPFTKGNFFLLDPQMPGGWDNGLKFGDFGDSRNLNGKFDRKLHGDSGLDKIYDKFEDRLKAFLLTLRKDSPADNFILEPEIRGSYEMRGCMDKLDDPKCIRLKKYVDDLKDFAFAQFLAYSRHDKKKYKYFFLSPGTWRRKLFSRYDVDLINLQKYYEALSGPTGLRKKQNKCLEDMISALNRDFATTEGVGLGTGNSNYYTPPQSNFLGAGNHGANYNKPKIKKNNLDPKSFSFNSNVNSFKATDNAVGSLSSNNGAGSGEVDGAYIGTGAMASRLKAIEIANANAIAKGVDLAGKEKELRDNIAKSGLMSGGGGLAGRGGEASPSNAASSSSYKATLGDENEMKGAKSTGSNKGHNSMGASQGSKAGNLSGISGGSSSGQTSGSESGSQGADSSGMSDEEKDRMSANYDRSKGEYKTKEDDTLFQVLSKTYVRNLDKILTRKKKLEEDSASAPSEPSAP